MLRRISLIAILLYPITAQVPAVPNPTVAKVVSQVSYDNVAAIMRRLEGFETRGNYTDPNQPNRGIGAARRWIAEQFKSYSPRLEVRYDSFKVKKQGRVWRDVEVVNVVAVLKGRLHPDREILICGHYDSIHLLDLPTDGGNLPTLTEEQNAKEAELVAPGVSDDASGMAAVMELARVMSQYQFDKTIVFIAFAGEEIGRLGSTLYAERALNQKRLIEAVFNNDIIGNDQAGNGRRDNRRVRVFSADPADSPSRTLARYIREAALRYTPEMTVDAIFMHDRFRRGGDHSSFVARGFAGVRFTTPTEWFVNQHSASDTFTNASPDYSTEVTRVNAAAAASLALAPPPPETEREVTSGRFKGRKTALLGRGKSGYDALLRWKPVDTSDLAGYTIVSRSTLSPFWEQEIWVGKVTEFSMPNVSIDDRVFGVRAWDKDGNPSLVAAFQNTDDSSTKSLETY
jgi:Peptidase family M28